MTRVCVIAINVTDMDRAIQFYRDALELEVEDRAHYPEIVQLRHDGVPLILQLAKRRAAIAYPDQAQSILDFETGDLAAAISRLKKAGAELLHKEPAPCPVGRFVAFRDPFGNVHEMLEFS